MSVDVHVRPEQHALSAAWGKRLAQQDYVLLRGAELAAALPATVSGIAGYWEHLDRDEALLDGGCYRYRRYGRMLVSGDGPRRWSFSPLPHAAFRQEARYIPGYGGRERMFSPILPETLLHPVLIALVSLDLAIVAASGHSAPAWEAGLHMIRIVADQGAPGQPTPEGRHRDGHAFIGMHLIARERCTGGESVLYPRQGAPVRHTLTEPLDSLVVADSAITHSVSPIVASGGTGVRDMLLLDLNAR